jgi:hypothetical protein
MINFDEKDYLLFLDESGTPEYTRLRRLQKASNSSSFIADKENPNFFTSCGVLISHKQFKENVIAKVKQFKKDKYNNETITFHLSDMISGAGEFPIYRNNIELFTRHMEEFVSEVKDVQFFLFPVTIHKVIMLNRYNEFSKPAHPYKYAVQITAERIANEPFQNSINLKVIRVWGESRTEKKDNDLKNFFVDLLTKDINHLKEQFPQPIWQKSIDNIRKIEWHIHFIPKKPEGTEKVFEKIPAEIGKDIVIGNQIADLMASTIRICNESDIDKLEANYKKIEALSPLIDLARNRNLIDKSYFTLIGKFCA